MFSIHFAPHTADLPRAPHILILRCNAMDKIDDLLVLPSYGKVVLLTHPYNSTLPEVRSQMLNHLETLTKDFSMNNFLNKILGRVFSSSGL